MARSRAPAARTGRTTLGAAYDAYDPSQRRGAGGGAPNPLKSARLTQPIPTAERLSPHIPSAVQHGCNVPPDMSVYDGHLESADGPAMHAPCVSVPHVPFPGSAQHAPELMPPIVTALHTVGPHGIGVVVVPPAAGAGAPPVPPGKSGPPGPGGGMPGVAVTPSAQIGARTSVTDVKCARSIQSLLD